MVPDPLFKSLKTLVVSSLVRHLKPDQNVSMKPGGASSALSLRLMPYALNPAWWLCRLEESRVWEDKQKSMQRQVSDSGLLVLGLASGGASRQVGKNMKRRVSDSGT